MTNRECYEGHFFDALDLPEGELVPFVIESIAEAGTTKDSRGQVIDLAVFSFRGETKRFVCGKTSWKNCKAMFGQDDGKWIGQTVNLQRRFLKAAQGFGQENCLCIRIVPPKGTPILSSAAKFMGSATPYGDVPRPKPSPPALTPEEQEFVDDNLDDVAAAVSLVALERFGKTLAGKSEAVRDAFRQVYRTRKEELESCQ